MAAGSALKVRNARESVCFSASASVVYKRVRVGVGKCGRMGDVKKLRGFGAVNVSWFGRRAELPGKIGRYLHFY